MSKFTKYFANALLNEKDDPSLKNDNEILMNNMEPEAATQLETEIENSKIPIENKTLIVKTAKKYYSEIKNWIVTIHELRNELLTGNLKSIAEDLQNVDLTKLATDLAKVSEGLYGKTLDSVTAPEEKQPNNF